MIKRPSLYTELQQNGNKEAIVKTKEVYKKGKL
jgi:hypothetical protein